MRDQRVHRDVFNREARRAAGLGPTTVSLWAANVAHAAHEAQHLALPIDDDNKGDIQNPATGAFYFMAGFSAAGGPDEVGP